MWFKVYLYSVDLSSCNQQCDMKRSISVRLLVLIKILTSARDLSIAPVAGQVFGERADLRWICMPLMQRQVCCRDKNEQSRQFVWRALFHGHQLRVRSYRFPVSRALDKSL